MAVAAAAPTLRSAFSTKSVLPRECQWMGDCDGGGGEREGVVAGI